MFKEYDLGQLLLNDDETLRSGWVFGSNPNDIWMPTMHFGLYHYNGNNVQKIESISGLPYGNRNEIGMMIQMVKSKSGKLWMLMETGVQQYIVVQGTPN